MSDTQTIGHGTFIVIEGTDKSHRDVQVAKLVERLEQDNYEVLLFDFPRYKEPSAFFVNEYLGGRYGSSKEVGPYTGSLLYALDRYQAAPTIRDALASGKVVIASGFTGSSMAKQGVAFDESEHRRGYFIWLDNLEFEMLRIPRPDRSIVLRIPEQTTSESNTHEAEAQVYDDLCQLFPRDFIRIDCARDNKILGESIIHTLLWQTIEPMLPPKPQTRKQPYVESQTTETEPAQPPSSTHDTSPPKLDSQGYFMPENLDPSTKTAYTKTISHILELHDELAQKAAAYLQSISDTPKAKRDATWLESIKVRVDEAIRPVLPLANVPHATMLAIKGPLDEATKKYLPTNHTSESNTITLTSVWPRNELELVADMLYESSNLPQNEIKDEVSRWPIDRRIQAFKIYVSGKRPRPLKALENVHYSWDLISDYGTFCDMQNIVAKDVTTQLLTPRYGYDIPQLIDDAGLTDLFEACFDLSLQLHSIMHAAGFEYEAQYAVLSGHKIRWSVTYNAVQMFKLYTSLTSHTHTPYRKLIEQLYERLREVHPILTETMDAAH